MPRIRLYTQKINPYSEKVVRALALKGLPLERIESDNPDDVAYWNPAGKILPVLEVDGERRDDSTRILHWLEELFPEPPLVSTDPNQAAAQWRMAEWSDTSFVWYWNRWRASRFPQPGDEQPVDPGLLERLKSAAARSVGRSRLSRADVRELQVVTELNNRLDDLVAMLGARDFFLSEHPSVADLSVFGMLHVMRESPMVGGGRALEERPALVAYVERMAELTKPV